MVGFLGAGFVLAALGVEGTTTLDTLADLGVVLLLFAIGLKLDVKARRQLKSSSPVRLRLSS